MSKRILLMASVGVMTAIMSHAVVAGNRPGAVTVSVGDAYYHFADKRNLDNIGMPNAALAYNFDNHWAVEVLFGLINTNINPPAVSVQHGVHGFLTMVDAIYRFNPYWRFEPFVEAGMGMMNIKPNGNNPEGQGNLNAGIGAQFFMNDSIAFKAEARDVYTLTGGYNDYMLNLTINFLFGGNQAKPERVNFKGE